MTECNCASCGKSFTRYAMNATRAAKPQYCSQECVNKVTAQRAAANLAKRFYARVNVGNESDCWEWSARRDPNGYGRIDIGGKPVLAHRIAFQLANGYECENVCHSCDNPPCCNPAHLWPGNPKLNAEDRDRKGRLRLGPPLKGSTNPASRLTEEQARYILASSKTQRALAARFGVSQTAIGLIKRGINWPHLQGK